MQFHYFKILRMLQIYPEGLRYMLRWLKNKFGDLEFFITENGYADTDPAMRDIKRVLYYKDHLEQVTRISFVVCKKCKFNFF